MRTIRIIGAGTLLLIAACHEPPGAMPPGGEARNAATVIPRHTRSPDIAKGLGYAPMDQALAWTRDGMLIVAHGERYAASDRVDQGCGGSGLWTVPAEGGGPARPLATGEPICRVTSGIGLAPDAAWAVFPGRGRRDRSRLLRLDLASGRVDTLVSGCVEALEQPSVSPDGARIAVVGRCDEAGREESTVYVMNVDGGAIRPVMRGHADFLAPAWSPDGAWVAATRIGHVVLAAADGSATRTVDSGFAPAWSPDGAWLAVMDDLPGERFNVGIYRVRPDGTDRRLLFRNAERGTPDATFAQIREGRLVDPLLWSPDGRWIAFTRSFSGGMSLWRVEVATGRLEQITAPAR